MIGTPTEAVVSLAQAASSTRWRGLPPEVQEQYLDLIRDTLAVIAAGLAHPVLAPLVVRKRGESGRCTVPGESPGFTRTGAAFLNGAATTVLQYQDGHRLARGHPMSHVLPAALAFAEAEDAPTDAFLAAIVAGYETGVRIGCAMNGVAPGLHDAGTWGTIAAAVAATHIVSRGNADAMAEAIESAAAVALQPHRDTAAAGAAAHHLYIGFGASMGVSIAEGAAAGWQGLSGSLETFFGPRAGAAFEPRALVRGMDGESLRWTVFEAMNAYIKHHPTCAHLHGINDATALLVAAKEFTPGGVDSVLVETYAHALDYAARLVPNDLAARFSIATTVALQIATGGLEEASFARIDDPAVRALAARVQVRHDPSLDAGYPAGRPARVTVRTSDGRVLSRFVALPYGDCTNPMRAEDRSAKALRLLALRYGPRADDVRAGIDSALRLRSPLSALCHALRIPPAR
jgi:2-methylcitrate dehydratase PrpD